MKYAIATLITLMLSSSLFANCSGWHEFNIVEQEDMQFLDSYLARFKPNLKCTTPLTKKEALDAAEKIIAAYQECTLCSEPDVDYKSIVAQIENGSYQFCKSVGHYSVDPWSWDSISTLMPINENGYNLSFIKTARE